jgi:type IV pilus assembly protein PilB
VAQRLVRRICPACRRTRRYSRPVLEDAGFTGSDLEAAFHEGAGCGECDDTGYRGRIGVFEVMPVSRAIRRLITEHATTEAIRRQALEDGMTTLREDGLAKVKAGITTLDEVLRETALV